MKILLPVDGSHCTKRMLSYIAAHDELLGRGHEYLAFTAIPGIPAYATHLLEHATMDGYYQDEADKVLAPVLAFAAQQGWTIRALHGHGHAAEVIAAVAAKEHVGLIVMGTHGHSSLGNVVLGSVASGVLARSTVPVLLVH